MLGRNLGWPNQLPPYLTRLLVRYLLPGTMSADGSVRADGTRARYGERYWKRTASWRWSWGSLYQVPLAPR